MGDLVCRIHTPASSGVQSRLSPLPSHSEDRCSPTPPNMRLVNILPPLRNIDCDFYAHKGGFHQPVSSSSSSAISTANQLVLHCENAPSVPREDGAQRQEE